MFDFIITKNEAAKTNKYTATGRGTVKHYKSLESAIAKCHMWASHAAYTDRWTKEFVPAYTATIDNQTGE